MRKHDWIIAGVIVGGAIACGSSTGESKRASGSADTTGCDPTLCQMDDGNGGCISSCGQGQQCQNGQCVDPPCDPTQCLISDGKGGCKTACDKCQKCQASQCLDACDPGQCQSCTNGSCQSNCGTNGKCTNGVCGPMCDPSQCQIPAIDGKSCQSACSPGQSCNGNGGCEAPDSGTVGGGGSGGGCSSDWDCSDITKMCCPNGQCNYIGCC